MEFIKKQFGFKKVGMFKADYKKKYDPQNKAGKTNGGGRKMIRSSGAVFIIVAFTAISEVVADPLSQTVPIPDQTYAVYDIPEIGAELILYITPGKDVAKILSSSIVSQDGSDNMLWDCAST